MMARRASGDAVEGDADAGDAGGETANPSGDWVWSRLACACAPRWRRACVAAYSARAFAACAGDQACQPVSGAVTSCMAMQSTGQALTHRPQPVQSASITVCMRLLPPTMQSTGQAFTHSVQPMHQSSSITATWRGASLPFSGLSGTAGRPVSAASRTIPSCPPGGHWLMGAPSWAMARA